MIVLGEEIDVDGIQARVSHICEEPDTGLLEVVYNLYKFRIPCSFFECMKECEEWKEKWFDINATLDSIGKQVALHGAPVHEVEEAVVKGFEELRDENMRLQSMVTGGIDTLMMTNAKLTKLEAELKTATTTIKKYLATVCENEGVFFLDEKRTSEWTEDEWALLQNAISVLQREWEKKEN